MTERSIAIFCDAPSHDGERVELCALVPRMFGDLEMWTPDDRAELQRLAPSDSSFAIDVASNPTKDSAPEEFRYQLERSWGQPSPIALRFAISCTCGDNLTVGDKLGQGYDTVLRQRHDGQLRFSADRLIAHNAADLLRQDDAERESRMREMHGRLTTWADSGASLLSLTGLRRILNL